jgi:dihydroorotate dehydrogenase
MKPYGWLHQLMFNLDAESAHNLTLQLLGLAGSLPPVRGALRRVFAVPHPELRVSAFGIEFPNPIGLAAGYDKQGLAMHGLACLGFGHLELGTVTPMPQAGNPRPRIFRLPEDGALINRMGFPNAGGADLLRRLLKARPEGVVVGVNIGKGADTPLERAREDYLVLLRAFYPVSDYLAVNVSSPNTIGLRRLQARGHLAGLLGELTRARDELQAATSRRVPLLVKLAPDLTPQELADAVDAIMEVGLDGVIATNTTVARESLRSPRGRETGGLSGEPLRERATKCVREIHRLSGGGLPIIGVGGVAGVSSAQEKLDAGASLVQIYTGLIYHGPGLVREILDGLRRRAS